MKFKAELEESKKKKKTQQAQDAFGGGLAANVEKVRQELVSAKTPVILSRQVEVKVRSEESLFN